jgi:hypothetical protein
MKKLMFLFLFLGLLMVGCKEGPIMYSSNYQVVDTIGYNYNGLRELSSYDVIIKIDTSYFYGKIKKHDEFPYLIKIERKIKVERLK